MEYMIVDKLTDAQKYVLSAEVIVVKITAILACTQHKLTEIRRTVCSFLHKTKLSRS